MHQIVPILRNRSPSYFAPLPVTPIFPKISKCLFLRVTHSTTTPGSNRTHIVRYICLFNSFCIVSLSLHNLVLQPEYSSSCVFFPFYLCTNKLGDHKNAHELGGPSSAHTETRRAFFAIITSFTRPRKDLSAFSISHVIVGVKPRCDCFFATSQIPHFRHPESLIM